MAAWLFARRTERAFHIRVEDVDPEVSRRGFQERQLADLEAIGIDWDGPVLRQSDRGEAYAEAIRNLEEQGLTYPCWCSRKEIREATTAPHVLPGAYPGTCRDLSAAGARARSRDGRDPALRLRSSGEVLSIHDELRGEVQTRVHDVVLRRNDGVPAYNLAVVVDDAFQAVDQVVRADDLLEMSPTQARLMELLGLPWPSWAHVSLVVGSDGSRLAKRHGSMTLGDLRNAGVAASTVRRWIDESLGIPSGDVGPFDPLRLPSQPIRFSPEQLVGLAGD